MPILSRVFKPVQLLLIGLDRTMVYVATPFGVHIKGSRQRYAVLLGIYAVIFIVGFMPIPVVPLVALTIGYIGVLAVGRAWVLNEKERTLIAKKLKDGNPDKMPDLRWTALVSALQLVVLFPLIFQQVQWHFGLYTVPEGSNFWTWFGFTLDSYNKAYLNLFEIYGVHFNHVSYDSTWGRHLMTLCRLTFDFTLIQGVFRLLAIRKRFGIRSKQLREIPQIAMLVGRRAVQPLIESLRDRDERVRAKAAEALGMMKDRRAVEPLFATLQDTEDSVQFISPL